MSTQTRLASQNHALNNTRKHSKITLQLAVWGIVFQ